MNEKITKGKKKKTRVQQRDGQKIRDAKRWKERKFSLRERGRWERENPKKCG